MRVHTGVYGHTKESALLVDSRRKIPCRLVESNLRQQRAGPTLYQLSYIPNNRLVFTLLSYRTQTRVGYRAGLLFGSTLFLLHALLCIPIIRLISDYQTYFREYTPLLSKSMRRVLSYCIIFELFTDWTHRVSFVPSPLNPSAEKMGHFEKLH